MSGTFDGLKAQSTVDDGGSYVSIASGNAETITRSGGNISAKESENSTRTYDLDILERRDIEASGDEGDYGGGTPATWREVTHQGHGSRRYDYSNVTDTIYNGTEATSKYTYHEKLNAPPENKSVTASETFDSTTVSFDGYLLHSRAVHADGYSYEDRNDKGTKAPDGTISNGHGTFGITGLEYSHNPVRHGTCARGISLNFPLRGWC